MLDLRYDADAQKQAFVEACGWAEEIYLCLAWIEPGDAHGPSYADLEPFRSKVRQAIVGLSRLQSDPTLLRRLHGLGVLRLVSSIDGSFSPNTYFFRNGARWRVLLASAPFTSTRFARPCESLVVFEGDRDDPFVLRAQQLLERCRAAAHVSTAQELDTYETAWADSRTGHGALPESIAGLQLQPYETSGLGELTVVTERYAVLEALVEVRDSFAAAASLRVPAKVLPRGAQPTDNPLATTLYWSSLGVWSVLHRGPAGFGLHLGVVPPWKTERPSAAVSLVTGDATGRLIESVADPGVDAMAVVRDEGGRRFVAHIALDAQSFATDVEVSDGVTRRAASLLGEVGAADFPQTAAAFALRIARRRAHLESEISS